MGGSAAAAAAQFVIIDFPNSANVEISDAVFAYSGYSATAPPEATP